MDIACPKQTPTSSSAWDARVYRLPHYKCSLELDFFFFFFLKVCVGLRVCKCVVSLDECLLSSVLETLFSCAEEEMTGGGKCDSEQVLLLNHLEVSLVKDNSLHCRNVFDKRGLG